MLHNDAVANLVRKDKCFQLPSLMTTAREQGMQLMDDELVKLVTQRIVSPEEALSKAVDKPTFASALAANGFLSGDDAKSVRGAIPQRPAGATEARPAPTSSGVQARPSISSSGIATSPGSLRPPGRREG